MNVDGGLLPGDARTFEMVRRFGWTLTDIDEQPAERVDWLLAMARVHDDLEREAHERNQRQ